MHFVLPDKQQRKNPPFQGDPADCISVTLYYIPYNSQVCDFSDAWFGWVSRR